MRARPDVSDVWAGTSETLGADPAKGPSVAHGGHGSAHGDGSALRVEDVLAAGGSYVGPVRGRSMWPMLRPGSDLVEVVPLVGRARRGDVVLFCQGASYVLHRVTRVLDDGYETLGDNSVVPERPREADVVGVLAAFERAGRRRDVRGRAWRAFGWLWLAWTPWRRALLTARARAGAARRWVGGLGSGVARGVASLCAGQAVVSALAVTLAPLVRLLVDAAAAGRASAFAPLAAALAVALALQTAVRSWLRVAGERLRARAESDIRLRAFDAALALGPDRAERLHTAEVMTRLTSDASVVSEALASLVPSVAALVVRFAGVVAVMWWFSPVLAALFCVAILGASMAQAALRPRLAEAHAAAQAAEGRERAYEQEALESLLVIRAFAARARVGARARGLARERERLRVARVRLVNVAQTLLSLLVQAGYLGAFVWCGAGMLQGTVGYGTLVATVQLFGIAQAPLTGLGALGGRFAAAQASARRLAALGDEELPASGRAAAAGAAEVPANGSETCRLREIVVDGLSFGYGEGRSVFGPLSARIGAGSFVAVTGESGAGKSTLLKLLLAAYRPRAGEVRYRFSSGGAERDVAPEELPAGLVAYVPQQPRLMAGTIREALLLGVSGAQEGPGLDGRLMDACRAACVDDVVLRDPAGLDVRLGEGGRGLSGGEVQRLALARAIASDAQVLLLDEATSALDAQTERRVVAGLRGLAGRTVILVTHRSEVAAQADDVIRLSS